MGPDKPELRGICFDDVMPLTRAAVTRETARRKRRLDLQTGEEIRRLRLDAGITLTALSAVVGVHRSHLARIEAGAASPSLEVLTAIGVALGADLSLRYFAGSGPRLHDRFQAPMIETLLRAVHPRWSAQLEVPVRHPSRGVIDLVLTDREDQVVVAAEVQSELRRLEQQIRWSAEKADGLSTRIADADPGGRPTEVSRLLVLRSTVATREIARRFRETLASAYPARTKDVLLALTDGTASWPGPGIVWIHLHGGLATLMLHPPPHVELGR
jgi:transcriptional regulator with XRE-family HTH domain